MARDIRYISTQTTITGEAPASIPRKLLPDIGEAIAQAGQTLISESMDIQRKEYARWLNGEINRVRDTLQNAILDLNEEFLKTDLHGQGYTDEYMQRFRDIVEELQATLHDDVKAAAEADINHLIRYARTVSDNEGKRREGEYQHARINAETQTILRHAGFVNSLEELNALKEAAYRKIDNEIAVGNLFPWQGQESKEKISQALNATFLESQLIRSDSNLEKLKSDLDEMEDLDADIRLKTLEAIANEQSRRSRELYNNIKERIQSGSIINVKGIPGLTETQQMDLENYQRIIQRQLARERRQDEMLARAEASDRWEKDFYLDWWKGLFTQEEAINRIEQAMKMDLIDPRYAASLRNQIENSSVKVDAIRYVNDVISGEKLPDPVNRDFRDAVDARYQQTYILKNKLPEDQELAHELSMTKVIPSQEISRLTGILANEQATFQDITQAILRADVMAKNAPEDFYKVSDNPYIVYLQWAVNNNTLSFEEKAKKIMDFRLKYHDLPTRKELEDMARSPDIDKEINKLISDGYFLKGIETRMQGPVRAQIKKYIPFGLIEGKDISEAVKLAYNNLMESRTGFGYSKASTIQSTEVQNLLKQKDVIVSGRIPAQYFSMGVFERLTGADQMDIVMDDLIEELKAKNLYEPPQINEMLQFYGPGAPAKGVKVIDGPIYRLTADEKSPTTLSFLIEKIDSSGNISPVYDKNWMPLYYQFDMKKYQEKYRKYLESKGRRKGWIGNIAESLEKAGEVLVEKTGFRP